MVNDYGQPAPYSDAKIVFMTEAKLKEWMQWLKEELLALVTDDDTYWRLQEEVIYQNHRLLTMRSPYFDMLHYAYVSTTASAIRRLTEKQNKDGTTSPYVLFSRKSTRIPQFSRRRYHDPISSQT
jgi:hypothetical protein